MITPDPVPVASYGIGPRGVCAVARWIAPMFTTAGPTVFATATTTREYASRGSSTSSSGGRATAGGPAIWGLAMLTGAWGAKGKVKGPPLRERPVRGEA